MKFSERWLREWVDPPVGTGGLVEQLTGIGLEVDSVEPVAGDLGGIVVAEVVEVRPHPDADRLSVCRVRSEPGAEPLDVVCGAPNVHAAMRAPFAPPGTRLPDGTKIRRSRIRGVESNGMLCSPIEIGLGDDADGILGLDPRAPVGARLDAHLGLDDHAIDVDLTPNRGDCLSVRGIAREVAAVNGLTTGGPALEPVPAGIEDAFPIHLDAPADCPVYVGRVIRDVDPQARTPTWIKERLRRSGLRAIAPVVDVTNYVMLELGQPMHAFDFETLEGAVRVRRGRPGERLELLDGTVLEADEDSLVIADEARAVALAGIMGGLPTAVSARTRHVFLESAWFLPRAVGVEARRRGLHTDSAHRFERAVAPGLQREAAERATRLLLDIVGGRPGPILEAISAEAVPRPAPIRLRPDRIRRLLGTDIPGEEVEDCLGRLGMRVEGEGADWRVTPPAHRQDVTIEADLVEEVVRIAGYDRMPAHAPTAALEMPPLPEDRVGIEDLRRVLVHRGYHEAITYSFVDRELQRLLDPDTDPIALSNPISSDLSVMRTTLWPGLLRALVRNVHRQQGRVRLFETGLRFRPAEGGRAPDQPAGIAGVATGPAAPEQWSLAADAVDFFDVKADVEALVAPAGRRAGEVAFEPALHPGLHPGRGARVRIGGEAAGWVGQLHPRIAAGLKLPAPVVVFELDLEPVSLGHVPAFEALSRHPSVRRDVAVVVDEAVGAAAVRDCVGQAAPDVLNNLELFDVYRGEHIDSGKKSLALRLTFQAPDRTLTEGEIEAAVAAIVNALGGELGAVLRD